MKKQHMKQLVMRILRLFPKSFAGIDEIQYEAMVEDYMAIMGDEAYKDVDAAINNLAKTQTFSPSIAEILEEVQAIKDREAFEKAQAVPSVFTDEDGYRYERIDGRMVCVYRPNRKPLADPELQAFMEEKRRIYAEVGAPKSYTMKQVRELARQKGMTIEEQEDMTMLSKILGRGV